MKRPYLLLEVLVSFALVALCATPLLHSQFSAKQKEKERALKIKNELLVEDAFNQIRMKFYTQEISWEHLQRGRTFKGQLDNPPYTYEISESEKYQKAHRALFRLNKILISIPEEEEPREYYLFSERVEPGKRQK